MTIAGMDSSGSAGVTVDLATFAALEVQGRSVVTAVTAQTDRAVLSVQGMRGTMVAAQLEAAFGGRGRSPKAAKCGMLHSGAVVESVADFWIARRTPLVIDPVLVSSSGMPLLNAAGVRALKRRLLPLATLVTPNMPEAEALANVLIKNPEDMRSAARAIFEQFGCAVVITGGHLRGPEIIEVFFDGTNEWLFTTPRLKGGPWRGTGCRFASAVAAGLAKGQPLVEAVRAGTEWVSGDLDRLKANG